MQQGSSAGCRAPLWSRHHAGLRQCRGCLCRAEVVLVSADAATDLRIYAVQQG